MSRTSAILDGLERQPRWVLMTGTALWTAAIGGLDWLTGTQVALSFFYMLPAALAAWVGRRASGLVAAVWIAGVWYLSDGFATGEWLSPVAIWNVLVRLAFLAFVVIVVASLHGLLEEQRDLARRDAQTGLANARDFRERAEVELRRLTRSGSSLTVAYCDVDNLKTINDTLGHEAGDRLLRAVGQAMRQALRLTDTVARMGGDEFALLLPDTAGDAACTALLKVRDSAHAAIVEQELEASVSIGAVWTGRAGEGLDALLHGADSAMYEVKGAGKDGVLVCAPGEAPESAAVRRPDRRVTTVRIS